MVEGNRNTSLESTMPPTLLKRVFTVLERRAEEKKDVFVLPPIKPYAPIIFISPVAPTLKIYDLNDFAISISASLTENGIEAGSMNPAKEWKRKKGGIIFPQIVFDGEEVMGKETTAFELKLSDTIFPDKIKPVEKPIDRLRTLIIICPSIETAEMALVAAKGNFKSIPKELKPSDELALGLNKRQLNIIRRTAPIITEIKAILNTPRQF